MRKIFALIALLAISTTGLLAQQPGNGLTINVSSKDSLPPIIKPARDFVMIQFGYTGWQMKTDSLNPKRKPFAYTFNAFMCYDFPIKKSKLSFAAGLGISTTTTYLDKQTLAISDTGVNGRNASFVKDSTNTYKRYKFNTAYVTAPFELRYFSNIHNRNKGFKAAIPRVSARWKAPTSRTKKLPSAT